MGADAPAPATASGLDDAFDTVYRLLRERHDGNLLEPVEKETVLRALRETAGNQAEAAKILGITRATLRKRMERYSIGEAD